MEHDAMLLVKEFKKKEKEKREEEIRRQRAL